MNHTRKRTPSLILLKSALITAKGSTPSRVSRPEMDPDEKLAALLVERIKHPQSAPLPIGLPEPSVSTFRLELAGGDV